jgi:hypothetical protein
MLVLLRGPPVLEPHLVLTTAGRESFAITTGVGSGAGAITTSRLPDGGEGVESSSKTITTSPLLGTASAVCSRTAREALASAVTSPSSTVATGIGGGSAIDASVAATAVGSSLACSGVGSVLGG